MESRKIKIWILLIPVYLLVAWPIVKWAKKAGTGDMNLSHDEYAVLNDKESEVRDGDSYAYSNPELYDGVMGVSYRTKAQTAADEKAAAARRQRWKEEEAKRPAAAAPRAAAAQDPASRRRELEFIRRHGGEIRRYQAGLAAIGIKYRNKYPALRQMDAEFARMGRYMALRNQYAVDGDAFKWARGVMALPEVRGALIRYSMNAEVLKGIIEASMEALRNPPPKPIYDEVARFLQEDDQASAFVNDISINAMGNVMSIAPTVASTSDLNTLTSLGSQIAGVNFTPAINR